MFSQLRRIADRMENVVDSNDFERYFDRFIVGLFIVLVVCCLVV